MKKIKLLLLLLLSLFLLLLLLLHCIKDNITDMLPSSERQSSKGVFSKTCHIF